MYLPKTTRSVVSGAVALAAALTLSACTSSESPAPPSGNAPATTQDAFGDVAANPPASSGGTATVVVDGVSYAFASGADTACMDANGLLVILLPMVSINGDPTDTSEGNLQIDLVIPG